MLSQEGGFSTEFYFFLLTLLQKAKTKGQRIPGGYFAPERPKHLFKGPPDKIVASGLFPAFSRPRASSQPVLALRAFSSGPLPKLFWAFSKLLGLFPAFSGACGLFGPFLNFWASCQLFLGLGLILGFFQAFEPLPSLFWRLGASFVGLFRRTSSGPFLGFWASSHLFWACCLVDFWPLASLFWLFWAQPARPTCSLSSSDVAPCTSRIPKFALKGPKKEAHLLSVYC